MRTICDKTPEIDHFVPDRNDMRLEQLNATLITMPLVLTICQINMQKWLDVI